LPGRADRAVRILHILDHSIPLQSGYTFRTLSILKAQRQLGWTTFHLTSPKQGISCALEETIDDWHFFRTPSRQARIRLPGLAQFRLIEETTRRVEEVARRVNPQVLHAHSPVLNVIPALRVGRRLNLPVVYEVRAFWEDAAVDHGTAREGGLRYRLSRALETYALHRVDAVTTICEGLRSDIVARGIAPDKVTVIPNAVDLEIFRAGEPVDRVLKGRLGLKDALVAGFVGSFYAYEGLDLLIAALPLVLRRAPQVRLLLVGGGPCEETLRQQARNLGVADKVIFTGRIPHGDVARYYGLVDVLVYPRHSMRLTELVTPLKPLEAMAQGKPVIASDVGGHREMIVGGETGLLFKAADRAALAEAIVAVTSDSQHRSRMVEAARNYVKSQRTWKLSVGRYQGVYEAVIRGE
jgi:PEP-CTERM/exosortase A-associated glycosyltransferase